jgi:DNA-binding CsgD family transcriptional regulator
VFAIVRAMVPKWSVALTMKEISEIAGASVATVRRTVETVTHRTDLQ